MKVVLLANAHHALARSDVISCTSPGHHMRIPIPLLPSQHCTVIGKGGCLLDVWIEALRKCVNMNDCILVTNGATYKHFERWATACDFPMDAIINDGSTSKLTGLGPAASLALLTRRVGLDGSQPVLVIMADSIPNEGEFSLAELLTRFLGGDEVNISRAALVSTDQVEASTWMFAVSADGAMEMDARGDRIIAAPMVRLAASALTSLLGAHHAAAPLSDEEKTQRGAQGTCVPSLAHLVSHLIGRGCSVKGEVMPSDSMRMLTYFLAMPGSAADEDGKLLQMYQAYCECRPLSLCPAVALSRTADAHAPIVCRANARVGVMGNPSDGFFGKTISMSIDNFWAEVRVWPTRRLCILPHPLYDPSDFGGLADLRAIIGKEGFEGGVRLLQATCKRFYEYTKLQGIELRSENFTIAYDTNVPRQVGLAGSSAIITAAVRALMRFHGVTEAAMPLVQLPSFVLSIEVNELGINAGLQDRVIQAYGGLVYMDFERTHLQAHGRGKYERLALDLAPSLWLAYLADPSDSGKIHSTVRARFDAGDSAVVSGMAQFASLTEQAKAAILIGDHDRLGELMNANFALRRELYGDGALGAQMLKLVSIAQSHGVPVKFPGSGGAVVGLRIADDVAMEAMRHDLERNGCVFVLLSPSPELL